MNMKMTANRKAHFETAMAEAREARKQRDFTRALELLEEAHILGQQWIVPHLRSHWAMLQVALLQLDFRETIGQVMRLVLVAPGTWLRRLPLGNTGRANGSTFQPMPVSERLQKLMVE
jgi:Protein of unknown function (DUF3703)